MEDFFAQIVPKLASAEGLEAGPGGHRGASHKSSAAGSHPHTGTSDQPLPGPAPTTLPPPKVTRKASTSRPLEPAS
jgi:transposase